MDGGKNLDFRAIYFINSPFSLANASKQNKKALKKLRAC